jgi:predicted nucleic acid-binding protein
MQALFGAVKIDEEFKQNGAGVNAVRSSLVPDVKNCLRLIHPSDQHWTIFQRMLREGRAVGNLVPAADLATLAIEHGCTLQSSDADFARFKGLKWNNPIA